MLEKKFRTVTQEKYSGINIAIQNESNINSANYRFTSNAKYDPCGRALS